MCIRDRYTTVLPNYFEGIKSYPPEEALDSALALVNNVSKKRLLSHIEEMILRLDQMELAEPDSLKDNPFAKQLMEETRLSASKIEAFKGIYTSYSLSSSSDCLKMEPFLLSPSDNQDVYKRQVQPLYQELREQHLGSEGRQGLHQRQARDFLYV